MANIKDPNKKDPLKKPLKSWQKKKKKKGEKNQNVVTNFAFYERVVFNFYSPERKKVFCGDE